MSLVRCRTAGGDTPIETGGGSPIESTRVSLSDWETERRFWSSGLFSADKEDCCGRGCTRVSALVRLFLLRDLLVPLKSSSSSRCVSRDAKRICFMFGLPDLILFGLPDLILFRGTE